MDTQEPRGCTAPQPGNKYDAGKPRWDLLPWAAVEQIVLVLTFGAIKYGPHNWRKVEDANNRYFAAAMRHLVAHQRGDVRDPETGAPHLAHAACCVLFLLSAWIDDHPDQPAAQ